MTRDGSFLAGFAAAGSVVDIFGKIDRRIGGRVMVLNVMEAKK